MSDAARVHLLVEGHVQGVGFRFYVQDKAAAFDLTGWVRNLHDDRVEIMAEGERAKLDEFINQVQRGPRNALITDLQLEWMPPAGNYRRFIIAPSE